MEKSTVDTDVQLHPDTRRPSRKPNKGDLSNSSVNNNATKYEKNIAKTRSKSMYISSRDPAADSNVDPKVEVKRNETNIPSKSVDISDSMPKDPLSDSKVEPKDDIKRDEKISRSKSVISIAVPSKDPVSDSKVDPKVDPKDEDKLSAGLSKRKSIKPRLPRKSLANVVAEPHTSDSNIQPKKDDSIQSSQTVSERVYPEFNLLESSILIKVNPGSRIFTGNASVKDDVSSRENSMPKAVKQLILGSSDEITTNVILPVEGIQQLEVIPETEDLAETKEGEVHPAVTLGGKDTSGASDPDPTNIPVELKTELNKDINPPAENVPLASREVPPDAQRADSQDKINVALPGKDDVMAEGVPPGEVSIKIPESNLDSESKVKTDQVRITAGTSPGRKSGGHRRSDSISNQPSSDIASENESSSLGNAQGIISEQGLGLSSSHVHFDPKEQSTTSSPRVICSGYSSAGIPCAGGPCSGETSLREDCLSLPEVENVDQLEPSKVERSTSISTMTCLQYRKSRIGLGLDSKVTAQGFMALESSKAWMQVSELSPLYQLLLHHGSMVVWSPVCPLAQHIRWDRGCTR